MTPKELAARIKRGEKWTVAEPHTTHWEGCEAVHPECAAERKPLSDEEIDHIIAQHVTITDSNLRGAIYMAMRDLEARHGVVE